MMYWLLVQELNDISRILRWLIVLSLTGKIFQCCNDLIMLKYRYFASSHLYTGQLEKAEKVLIRLRGTNDVEEELKAIVHTCQVSASLGKFLLVFMNKISTGCLVSESYTCYDGSNNIIKYCITILYYIILYYIILYYIILYYIILYLYYIFYF